MFRSKCDLKMHVQNLGHPLPYKSGAQKQNFRRFRNLTATLTAYIFGMKHNIHKGASALQTTRGLLYIVSKRHEFWSTSGFKLDVSFHPPSVNYAFHFIARLRRRTSANGTQPNFAKRWTVNRTKICRIKVGVVPPEKNLGPKHLLHLFDF